jgi:hypothetical protein
MEAQIERLSAVAAADLQNIAKALGGDQSRLGAGALQQGVDDKRRRQLIRDDVFCSVQSAMRVTFCRFEEGSTKAEETLGLPDWLAGKQSMSALGHELPRLSSAGVSALPPNADSSSSSAGVY